MSRNSARIVFAFMVASGLVLSACARAAPTPSQPSTSAETPQAQPAQPSGERTKVRVTVWLGQAELDAMIKLGEAYTKQNPNVDIEWINITGGGPYGRDKLQAMIAGNDAPDVMMLNTGQFEGFAARGALLELDSMVARDQLDLEAFWPVALEGSKFGGKLYGVPKDISNVVMYYNKDLFDKAGVAYPTSDWTWNDLREAAKKLTIDKNGDGQMDQWGVAVNNIVWVWASFVWSNGGEALSPDRKECKLTDPKSIEALDFYYGLSSKDGVSPPPGALPEQGWAGDWFTTQSVAMGFFGPWFRPTLVNMEKPFKWDVAMQPLAPNTNERASVVYTDMWGIYNQTKVPDAAWDLVKFLTGKEGQGMWLELMGARSISPIKEIAQSEGWKTYGGSSGGLILDQLPVGRVPPVNFANANAVETIWDQELGLVIAGEKNVQEAVDEICKQVSPVLAGE